MRNATNGVQKQGFTVALCAFTNGVKLPALIVSKEREELGQWVQAAINCPWNVRVTATTNGWMTCIKV